MWWRRVIVSTFLVFVAWQLTFAQQTYLVVDTTKFIEWNEESRLGWKDYLIKKGGGDKPSFAVTSVIHSVRGGIKKGQPNFQVKVLFVRKDSWTTDDQSTRLLAHEQLHFDLAELYGRKMRKQIQTLADQGKKKISVYRSYVKLLIDEYKRKSVSYDDETNHGANDAIQEEWRSYVQLELERLQDYK